jgi:hypothetical protein
VRAEKSASGGYPAAAAGLSASFAVNFFPARPAPAGGPATLHTGHAASGSSLTASIQVDAIWVFEALALAILATEWWIAFRGVRLR